MAYELHIYEQCKDTDQAAVAKREDLHPETVKAIFQRWAKRAKQQGEHGVIQCLVVDEISLLKGIRWILVRHRADLKPEEEAKLQAALDAFPELRTAYLLKERFVTIANKIDNRSRAELFLRAWVI